MCEPWLDDLADRLEQQLAHLVAAGDDWDGQGSQAVTPSALISVQALVRSLILVPETTGGVAVSMQLDGYGTDVIVGPGGSVVEVVTGKSL